MRLWSVGEQPRADAIGGISNSLLIAAACGRVRGDGWRGLLMALFVPRGRRNAGAFAGTGLRLQKDLMYAVKSENLLLGKLSPGTRRQQWLIAGFTIFRIGLEKRSRKIRFVRSDRRAIAEELGRRRGH